MPAPKYQRATILADGLPRFPYEKVQINEGPLLKKGGGSGVGGLGRGWKEKYFVLEERYVLVYFNSKDDMLKGKVRGTIRLTADTVVTAVDDRVHKSVKVLYTGQPLYLTILLVM